MKESMVEIGRASLVGISIALVGICGAAAFAAGQSGNIQRVACEGGAPTVAIAACTELLDKGNLDDASRVVTYVNRANAYDNLDEPDRALKDYDSALAINPRNAAAHRNKGSTLNRHGRLREALPEFDAAISLQPDYPLAYASRADNLRAQADLASGDSERHALFERAIVDYDQAIRLQVRPIELAYRNRGYLHYYLGHLDAAIGDFTTVIDLADDPVSYMARAIAYTDRGDVDRASADIVKASALANDQRLIDAIRQTREYIEHHRK